MGVGIGKGVTSIEVNGQVWDRKDQETFGLPIIWDTENGDINVPRPALLQWRRSGNELCVVNKGLRQTPCISCLPQLGRHMGSIQKFPGSKSLRKTYTNPAAMKMFWGLQIPQLEPQNHQEPIWGAQLSRGIIVLFPEESPGFACVIRSGGKKHQPVLLIMKIKVNSQSQGEKLGLNRG